MIRKTVYDNGISLKIGNKRVTVCTNEQDGKEGFYFEFRILDPDPSPRAICEHVHGKLAITSICLTDEAARMMVDILLELMNKKVCK